MPDFFVPITPTNYRDDWGSTDVHGDVFNICERLAAISPNLLIRDRRERAEDGGYRWVVSEISLDGRERWVFGIKHGELDGRVVEKIERMLHVPFEQRFAEMEKMEARIAAEEKEAELDYLVETMGLPMLPLLERTGFIQRNKSYAKGNATAIRHRNSRLTDGVHIK